MLEVKGLCAAYGTKTVLCDLDVAFAPARLTVLVGRNGSGKSTLLRAILGISCTTQGEVVLDGAPLNLHNRTDVARRIAYLPQGRDLPDMTVSQLVLHGRFAHLRYPRRYTQKDRAIAHAAMEQMGVASVSDTPLRALSGGGRQNAYLAMALAQDTPYLLLDEPTTYLDIANQISFMQTLRALTQTGKGIVAVLHDLPLAFSFADEIIVLQEGKIVAQGAPRHLCESGTVERVFGVSLAATPEGYCYRSLQ